MSRLKTWSRLLVVFALIVFVTVEILAEQSADRTNITIRQLEPQTVLYTIHRGSYEKMGQGIGRLYALAVEKKIWPRGQLSCVYLNNPKYVSSEHYLIEIRIPVGQDALKLAGTLGEMTDVKTLPAMEVVVATKQVGLTDPAPIYDSLNAWIHKQGYIATENFCERFLNDATSGNYAQMKSEIMVPVKKISSTD